MEMVIGFVGTGVMGKSMVKHLLNAGYKVNIYTRTKEKANELVQLGANWCSLMEVARQSQIIFTMVGFPHDVEEVYLSSEGILANAESSTYVIDMTTSSPTLAATIYEQAKEKGISSLDAPVSGGDIGARDATLTIMVGGDEASFNKMESVLRILGKNIVYQGKAGAGQHTKMCNQIAIASGMVGVCEAMVYAEKSGLDPQKVLQSISAGAAGSWSLSNLAPRMLQGNFEPGFYVKHFIKDMKIAIEEAEKMKVNVPGLTLAKQLYDKLVALGEENSGTQALYKLWRE
ncbi:NAD(P)-dependent oxidoreductase [Bacillus suaedaesalsae]|uniref:NAD(P)-dependent oxidoreductase n=1 Tax=Bacillus suaedaesalsae TaxID=2810349 RepID=A0ABS2DGF5_9BACI|nr:NAD(P)-dependent oxidoreductase [Bacillus suaedaesalsae]MBM6617558.1 NAD(P)-dependent oxidoreductase [Bacillus suaedaesalsae]